MTMTLCVRLHWVLGLWLLLVATSFIPSTTLGYDLQTHHTSAGYDAGSPSATDYDSASVLLGNETNTRAIVHYGLFAQIAEFVAAKNTTSLLPARSPWPGNSGFIEGTVERKFLMPGETIDRYGFGGGRFVSPAGTSLEARALRPGTENLPFNSYQVVKPFEVNAGGVQPWFGQPGLGTQYELPVSVNTLLNRGIIKPAP